MIEYIVLGLSSLSFIFLAIAIIYILKLARFEDPRITSTQNILLFGFFFLLFHLAITAIEYLNKSFPKLLISLSANIPSYIESLKQIDNLAFIPLFFVCLLVGMIVLKEA